MLGEVEVLHAAGTAQAVVEVGVVAGDEVVVIDHLGQRGEAAIVHEWSVRLSARADEIAQARRAGVGEIGPAADSGDDAVVQTSGINVELGRLVASGAAGAGLRLARRRGRIEKEGFAGVFLCGEVGERHSVVGNECTARIELRIERLNAADELRECELDARLGDRGIAEGHREQHAVFIDGGELGGERGEIRIAGCAAESHLDMVAHRLRRLVFHGRGALVPEEAHFVGETLIDQPHRVAAGGARHAGARHRGIGEGV